MAIPAATSSASCPAPEIWKKIFLLPLQHDLAVIDAARHVHHAVHMDQLLCVYGKGGLSFLCLPQWKPPSEPSHSFSSRYWAFSASHLKL